MPKNPKQRKLRPDQDPADIAMQAAQAMGNPEIGEEVLSGMMPARGIAPFIAGVVNGLLQQLVMPTIQAKAYKEFVFHENPRIAEITLKNGEMVRITIEAFPE